MCEVPLGQRRTPESPCGSSRDATRGAPDRLLPSHVFVRAPAPRRFPSSRKRPLACSGIRLLHDRAIHFGGAPALAGARASDTPVAPLARGQARRPKRLRESMRLGTTTRSVFRRARTFAPRRSLERPAPTFAGAATLPPQRRLSMPLDSREPFLGSRGPGPPSMRPVASGGALLWTRDIACRLLQPYTTRGHTRRASDPRARAPASHDPLGSWVGVKLRAPGSSARAFAGPGASRVRDAPTENHVRRRFAKSDSAQRIRAPSVPTELLRERLRKTPPCAPEPRLHHATSAEALLGSAHAFWTGSTARN